MALVETGPRLAASAWATFWMALQALMVAGLAATALALTVSLNPTAERAVRPLAVTLQVTPVVAIAPLVLIWAGLDNADRAVVALAATVAFFPLFSGVLTGLFGKPADAKGLFLLEQSALALRVASKLDHEESNAGEAISDAVAETSRVHGDLIRAVMG